MRNLNNEELNQVYGSGGDSCKQKGNNGWGNGGDDPPPGNSLNGNNSQTDSKAADELR